VSDSYYQGQNRGGGNHGGGYNQGSYARR
jgi:hypothetical protein